MLRHIVFFKVNSDISVELKALLLSEVKSKLEALPVLIPEIKQFEVGINICSDVKAADLVLTSEFESAESLRTYQEHPAHQAFVAWNRDKCPRTAVVDYFI